MIHSVFISHAWRYDSDYTRIVSLLTSAPRFAWRNYSVPKHDPVIAHSIPLLKKALNDQIRPAHVVLVLAGIYVSHSEWIQYEINQAASWGKKIIGVRPWGSQRLPRPVWEAADEVVGWNTASVTGAIRRLHH